FLSLAISATFFATACANSSDHLTFDVLDIGKADCIVMRHKGQVLLIDTGEEENLPEIESHLSSRGISKIDYLILSHFDKDHVGGAAVMRNVQHARQQKTGV
ncbi:MAG: MBL fold metallo-hydrolase, partial [Clostridia bacterium]|nr:MBL fold metallo-hydrolase [Clostridia bacterium]